MTSSKPVCFGTDCNETVACDDCDWYTSCDTEDDEEEGYCPACSGSGEGMYDGTKCSSCHGSGEVGSAPDYNDPPDRYLEERRCEY